MQQTRLLLGARSRLAASTQAIFNQPMRCFSHKDNFMSGQNANYIDFMYSQWKQDPASVHASWNAYFTGGEGSFNPPPTLGAQPAVGNIAEILAAL